MGSLACVFSVLRVSGQLVGSPDPFKPGLGFTTLGQKKVAPQTPLRPGLGLQPSDFLPPHTPKPELNASRDRGQHDCYITTIEIGNNRKFNKLPP